MPMPAMRCGASMNPLGARSVGHLALLVILAFVLGCQGGRFGRPASFGTEDAVHRIVASGQLRVGVSGVQPPLNMKDRTGALIGLDVDLAEALAEAMDLELVVVERPFAELLPALEKGELDLVISSLTITPARNAQFAFAGPYLISGATVLTRQKLVAELDDQDALDSPERTWGVRAGSTGEALAVEALPSAKRVAVDDLATLIPRIASGEIDGLISDLPFVRFALARHPDEGLAELPMPLSTEPIGVALPADSPLLANLVQNYLNTLEYTGLLMEMKAYWLGDDEWLSELSE
jgi:polar amino acid transport system substrate-binding protein